MKDWPNIIRSWNFGDGWQENKNCKAFTLNVSKITQESNFDKDDISF
jgi:hypothetical protein